MPSLKIDIIVDDQGRPIIDRTSASIRQLGDSAHSAGSKTASAFSAMHSGYMKLSAALAGMAAVGYLGKQLLQIADSYTLLDNKLKLVSASSYQLKSIQEGLYQQSLRSFSSYESSVDLYSRFARATEKMGVGQSELLRITETLNKAMIISGATQEESRNAIIQLSQGMASGVLRGEEFNSVMEQGARVSKMLADHLGVDIGQLREMAKEGKLTSGVMIDAFTAAAGTIDAEFSKMQPTISQAMTNLETVFDTLISDSNKAGGGTKAVSEEIMNLAKTIDSNREGILSLFTAMVSLTSQIVNAMGQAGQLIKVWNAEAPAAVTRGTHLGTIGTNPIFGIGDYVFETWVSKIRQKEYNDVIDLARPSLPAGMNAENYLPAPGRNPAARAAQSGTTATKALKELNKEYEELIKNIDKGEQAMMRAWEGHGGGTGADGIWQSVDAWKEASKVLVDYEKRMENFDDIYATNTANAKNELDALLTAEKSFIADSKGQWDELKQAIDGWGKDSAQAITDFCITGKVSFNDMIESMIADLFKMSIYQSTTGPLFSFLSEKAGGWLTDLMSPGGQSMGYGDWTGGLAFHGGGIVGYDTPAFTHPVPSSLFDSAPRFHSGMRPDEFPAILQKGEGVFTKNQMRAMGGGGSGDNITIINNISAVDSQSFADALERNPASVVKIINGSLKNNAYGLRSTIKRTR